MMPPIFKKCLQVNRFSKFWQVHLSKLRFFNFFDNDPIRLDSDGRLALLDLHRTIILSTFLLLLPLANLTLPLPMNKNIQLISDQQKHEQKVKKKSFSVGYLNQKAREGNGRSRSDKSQTRAHSNEKIIIINQICKSSK